MQDSDILTPAMFRMLGLVLRQTREKGLCPTLRELARAYGCHHNNVKGLAVRLKRAGFVTWEPGQARTLRPTCRVELVAAPARGKRKVRRG